MKLFSFFSSFITTNHIDIGTRYLLFCIMTLFLVLFFALVRWYLLNKSSSLTNSFLTPYFDTIRSFITPFRISVMLLFSCILALFFQIYSSAFILFLTLLYCFFKQYNLLVLIQITIFFRLLWFFTPLSEIVSMTSPYRSFTCVFSILSYLFFLRYHKYFVLWISIVLRLFLVVGVEDLGAIYLGGNLTVSQTNTKNIVNFTFHKHGTISFDPDYFFFDNLDQHRRVPIRTNPNYINNGWSEFFPSFSRKFFTETFIQKQEQSLTKDIQLLKNLKLNQGAAFSNLNSIHHEVVKYYSLNPDKWQYHKDAFLYNLLLRHYSSDDLGFLLNLGQYNFNRENIIMLTSLSERFDNSIIQTFEREYGFFDGTLVVNNNVVKLDCYSPLGNTPNLNIIEEKLIKGVDLVILGNLKDDFSSFSTDRILGVKGNSLSNVSIVRDINEEIEILTRETTKPVILSHKKEFTILYDEFIKSQK